MFVQSKRLWPSQPMAAKLQMRQRTDHLVLAHVPPLLAQWSRRPMASEQHVARLGLEFSVMVSASSVAPSAMQS